MEKKPKKGSTFTCPNLSCGKEFTTPLKALNLQKDPAESYDACPYCLIEIVVEEEPAPLYTEPENFEQEEIAEPEEAETEIEEPASTEEPEPVEPPEAPAEAQSNCLHHLGYLSEKSSSEQIPDECMVCKDIVTCMLKKMKE